MKKYLITYYALGVQHSLRLTAKNYDDALSKAWAMVDADDLYVSEIEE